MDKEKLEIIKAWLVENIFRDPGKTIRDRQEREEVSTCR